MKKALLYLFVFILIQFVTSWAVYAAWILLSGESLSSLLSIFTGSRRLPLSAPMLITASAAGSIVTLILFIRRRWTVMSPQWLRSRHWDVLAWCVAASLGTILPSVWLQEQLPEMPDFMEDTFRLIMSSQYGYFAVCLLAPFAEEVVFRGATLKALLGSLGNRWTAILISAAVFAIVHGNPAQMPHALLIGVLLGWMYSRTGSILPGVVLHWTNNTVSYAEAKLLPFASDMKLAELFGGSEKHVYLSILFSLCLLVPAIIQLNMRMKK